jgi:ParB family chromosome partitioning protein
MSSDLKKRGLGRGLAALLANTSGESPAGAEAAAPHPADSSATHLPGNPAASATPREIELDALSPNPHQPRGQFSPDSLAELAESIRVHGIIQPLVVTPVPERSGHFWIIAGERRWRAARLAGLTSAPVILREGDSQITAQALTELALVENIQREDLNAIEEALAYQSLIEDCGLTQAEVAERVGRSRPAVANAVRLLGLPTAAQQAVVDGRIAAGHARALLALPDEQSVTALLQAIEQQQLSVRQTELLVKQWLEAAAQAEAAAQPPARSTPDPQLLAHLGHLENRFRSALGTKVNLNRNEDGSGRLVVHFYSDDDLQNIYRLIAGEDETP